MALLTIKDLVLGYESKAILKPLNFQVQRGDYLCIVGENGSGKTTLLRMLAGITQAPAGTITIDGKEPDKLLWEMV